MSRDRETRLNREIAERYGSATSTSKVPGRTTPSESPEEHEAAQPDAAAEHEAGVEPAAQEQAPASSGLYSKPSPFAAFADLPSDDADE